MDPRRITTIFLVVGAIGLVALAIEWLRMRLNGWLALIVVSMVLLVMALLLHPARARDDGRYAGSPLKPWFDQLRSGAGVLCCSDADGTALSDVDWESRDGRFRVRIEGEWHDVPPDAVITEPNRAGRTMVWPQRGYMGLRIVCFMPGPMT